MKLIGTNQLLFCNDYLHVLGASICTIKENTEVLVFLRNEIDLELNDEKTKYMVMSRNQHSVQNQNIYMGNKSFERLEHFSYLGTSLTNPNSFHEEIKCRLQTGNACYYWVQNRLSSSLLSKNIKVQIFGTIILPFVLYGCDTWSPTVCEEHRLRVLGNRVLRKVFGPMRGEVTGEWGI